MSSINVNDACKKAIHNGYYLSKFLDFKEQSDFSSIDKNKEYPNLTVSFFGGFDDAERSRALVYNRKQEYTNDLFEISLIKCLLPKNHTEITHRHVLGTIMSLGIERNTFGDIIVTDKDITIVVSNEIKDFLIKNLTNIFNTGVKFEETSDLSSVNKEAVITTINVSSLRLDALISKTLNKSRTDASDFIKEGNVLINYEECTNLDHLVKPGDLLSIRHFGRIKIVEIVGKTKKDRLNVLVEIKH